MNESTNENNIAGGGKSKKTPMPKANKTPIQKSIKESITGVSIVKLMAKNIQSFIGTANCMQNLRKFFKERGGTRIGATRISSDAECGRAAETSRKISADSKILPSLKTDDYIGIQNYKIFTERNNGISLIVSNETVFSYLLKFDKTKKKNRLIKTLFRASGRGYCGNCWLCGFPVYYYKNKDNVTGCGECEHKMSIIG